MILETSMGSLVFDFLYSLALGIVFGILFDLFRVLRISLGAYKTQRKEYFEKMYSRRVKKYFKLKGGKIYCGIITAICDVLFFTVCACFFSVFLYVFNYGIFRWFLLIGASVGFWLYYVTFGKAFNMISLAVAEFIILIINITLSSVIAPLMFIIKYLKTFAEKFFLPKIKRIYKNTEISIDNIKLKRYTLNSMNKVHDIIRFQ